MKVKTALSVVSLAVLAATGASESARALTVTIDDFVLAAAPGQNAIVLQGNFGTPQPGFLDGLRLGPSSGGVTPIVSVIDTPLAKGILLTDVAVTGPRSANPFFYPRNSHSISIQHDFTPFAAPPPVGGVDIPFPVSASVGMSGSYAQANRFVLGGELEVGGFLNGDQINGVGVNSALTPPLFIPGVSDLIYHPADDIRFRGGDLPNHSCDNIIGNPTRFACSVSELFLNLGPETPLDLRIDIDLTFVQPDTFFFPGSVELTLAAIPEPSGILLLGVGLLALAMIGGAASASRRVRTGSA